MDTALPDALTRLRDDLKAARLSLELDGAREAQRARDDTVAQIDDYLLPRLRQMDAPLLMVVGGSTGREVDSDCSAATSGNAAPSTSKLSSRLYARVRRRRPSSTRTPSRRAAAAVRVRTPSLA